MENLLKESVEALKQLRTEMHSSLEDRAIDRIDETIRNLENIKDKDGRQFDAIELLNLVGKVLELLPTVGKAIEYLAQITK